MEPSARVFARCCSTVTDAIQLFRARRESKRSKAFSNIFNASLQKSSPRKNHNAGKRWT